jgi:hypothetical protein
MNCPECSSEVEAIKDADFEANGLTHYFPVDKKIQDKIKKYEVPFICPKCGGLNFPWKALKGVVMVWPKPIPEKIGSLYIPDKIKGIFKTSIGLVMSTGKGCKDKRTNRFVASDLFPGDVLSYDSSIPWQIEVPDSEGNKHTIDMMSILDVTAKVEED